MLRADKGPCHRVRLTRPPTRFAPIEYQVHPMITAALQVLAQTLAATGLGAAGGIMGGLFGVGGGVIVIQLLGMLCGLDQQVAQGTTLVMVVPNVFFGFWRYHRLVGLDRRIAATLAISALAATYPVARIATGLDPHHLRLAFAGFLVILSAIVAYRTWRGYLGSPGRPPLAWGWSAVLGAAGGVVSGLFGVGGAFIAPPVLTALFGVRQIEAQGLALALVCPGTVVALLTYAGAGQVEWRLGVPLAIGGIAAISAGVAAAHRLPERGLRLAFCGLLTITAGLLALHG
jgi:hypothetical protein